MGGVKRVIDGDTFVLESGEHVRLIGIDTPETIHSRRPAEPFWENEDPADALRPSITCAGSAARETL